MKVGDKSGIDKIVQDDAVRLSRSSDNSARRRVKGDNVESEAVQLQISSVAKEIGAVDVSELSAQVRPDKVAHFKQLIARDDYKPDSGKVAESFVRSILEDILSVNSKS